jgi:hypothetical protein
MQPGETDVTMEQQTFLFDLMPSKACGSMRTVLPA